MKGDFLKHYGILGMRWGRRRYQSEDGGLTELGKLHYKASKVEYGEFSKVANDSSNIIRTVGKAIRRNRPHEDLSKYTDKELQQKISRLNMERSYRSLTEPEMSRGAEYATTALSVIGSMAAIGASISTIVMASNGVFGKEKK